MTSVKIDPALAALIEKANALEKSGVNLQKAAERALAELEAPLPADKKVTVAQETVEAVIATVDAATKVGDVDAFLACFTPELREKMGLVSNTPDGRAEARMVMELMGSLSKCIGRLLEDGADRKVYAFSSQFNNTPQVFVRRDAKWYLAS